MYRSQLEELCPQNGWGFLKYSFFNEGDDHFPRFKASVSLMGFFLDTPDRYTSSEDALDNVALNALKLLTSDPPSDPEPSAEEQKVMEAHKTPTNISSDPDFTTAVPSQIQLRPDHSQNAEFLDHQGDDLTKLKAVELHLFEMQRCNVSRLRLCDSLYKDSARNLIHHLAINSLDVDKLKDELSSLGLPNLETTSSCVHTSLSAHMQLLEKKPIHFIMPGISERNRNLLLGQPPNKRTHIMVTIGEEALESETVICELLKAGMTVIRINCANGNSIAWEKIIRKVQVNSQTLKRECRVLMDLDRPKRYEGLTANDLKDLQFVADLAQMVGIAARDASDLAVLRQVVQEQSLGQLGIVFKLDTKDGFKNLPVILLEGMTLSNPLGVMVDRGDLAVECGWEYLANVQEQILSICGAAHVPMVWATALDSLVKKGVPTTAELSDVASGRRASCIMLNNGKHIVEAVSTLDTILRSSTKVKMNTALLLPTMPRS